MYAYHRSNQWQIFAQSQRFQAASLTAPHLFPLRRSPTSSSDSGRALGHAGISTAPNRSQAHHPQWRRYFCHRVTGSCGQTSQWLVFRPLEKSVDSNITGSDGYLWLLIGNIWGQRQLLFRLISFQRQRLVFIPGGGLIRWAYDEIFQRDQPEKYSARKLAKRLRS